MHAFSLYNVYIFPYCFSNIKIVKINLMYSQDHLAPKGSAMHQQKYTHTWLPQWLILTVSVVDILFLEKKLENLNYI